MASERENFPPDLWQMWPERSGRRQTRSALFTDLSYDYEEAPTPSFIVGRSGVEWSEVQAREGGGGQEEADEIFKPRSEEECQKFFECADKGQNPLLVSPENLKRHRYCARRFETRMPRNREQTNRNIGVDDDSCCSLHTYEQICMELGDDKEGVFDTVPGARTPPASKSPESLKMHISPIPHKFSPPMRGAEVGHGNGKGLGRGESAETITAAAVAAATAAVTALMSSQAEAVGGESPKTLGSDSHCAYCGQEITNPSTIKQKIFSNLANKSSPLSPLGTAPKMRALDNLETLVTHKNFSTHALPATKESHSRRPRPIDSAGSLNINHCRPVCDALAAYERKSHGGNRLGERGHEHIAEFASFVRLTLGMQVAH